MLKAVTSDQVWRLKKDGKTVVIPVQGNLISNNVDLIRRSAIAGYGITMLPESVIRQELQSGQLIRLFPSYSSIELSLFALYPERQWIPKKTSLFIEHLTSMIKT